MNIDFLQLNLVYIFELRLILFMEEEQQFLQVESIPVSGSDWQSVSGC